MDWLCQKIRILHVSPHPLPYIPDSGSIQEQASRLISCTGYDELIRRISNPSMWKETEVAKQVSNVLDSVFYR